MKSAIEPFHRLCNWPSDPAHLNYLILSYFTYCQLTEDCTTIPGYSISSNSQLLSTIISYDCHWALSKIAHPSLPIKFLTGLHPIIISNFLLSSTMIAVTPFFRLCNKPILSHWDSIPSYQLPESDSTQKVSRARTPCTTKKTLILMMPVQYFGINAKTT